MRRPPAARSGSVLIEFALVALVLYLLLAAAIEFSRAMLSANVTQSAAQSLAEVMAGRRKPGASPAWASAATFDDALSQSSGVGFDEGWLVVRATPPPDWDAAPLVNRQLRPLMILDLDPDSRRAVLPGVPLIRYPGALVAKSGTPTGYTVKIPLVTRSGGGEVVPPESEWLPVVREAPPPQGSSQTWWELGYAAVEITYPFQAAALASYPAQASAVPEPNVGSEIEAAPEADDRSGPNSGAAGLGRLQVMGKEVRPYRKVLTLIGNARREPAN